MRGTWELKYKRTMLLGLLSKPLGSCHPSKTGHFLRIWHECSIIGESEQHARECTNNPMVLPKEIIIMIK